MRKAWNVRVAGSIPSFDFGTQDDRLTLQGTVVITGDVLGDTGTDTLTFDTANLTVNSGTVSGFEVARVIGDSTVDGNINWDGDGVSEVLYLWGAQLEQSNTVTSFIPTSSGPVTRNTDLITYNGLAGHTDQTGTSEPTRGFLWVT